MKRKYLAILFGGALCILSGCAQSETAKNHSPEELVVTEQEDGGALKISEVKEFNGEMDFAYNSETDAQSNLGQLPNTAYSPSGKYRLTQDETGNFFALFFEDDETGQEVVLCNKSNCAHNNGECNAVFLSETYESSNLWYYEGNLYTQALYDEYVWMEKISLDGTTREKTTKVIKLGTQVQVEEDGNESVTYYHPEMQIHRGNIYYTDSYPGGEVATLWKMPMDGSKVAEPLFTVEGSNVKVYRILPFGRYVFFQAGCMGDADGNVDISLYVYDTESEDQVYLIKENVFRSYRAEGNYLYYEDLEKKIHQLNLETEEDKIYFDKGSCPELEATYSDFFIHDGMLVFRAWGQNEFQVMVEENGECHILKGDDMVECY